MQSPSIAITENEILKLVAPAINPINGGPDRKPRNPIVETAASATPGDMTFDLPAALYTSGTTEDTPKPTSRKPRIAVPRCGNNTAITRPVAVRMPLH